ncbi:hypothetical protein CLV71_12019 [Actinophytocola oryzae]|uniref:Uncharacterized protein n=1 Tax=Actinophytocola oryzae TaxID=502181 RepID=A0A4R7UX08_9PSEU|nr:hypothetical protein CLV71_12019 [Actinophytocola oryzae]
MRPLSPPPTSGVSNPPTPSASTSPPSTISAPASTATSPTPSNSATSPDHIRAFIADVIERTSAGNAHTHTDPCAPASADSSARTRSPSIRWPRSPRDRPRTARPKSSATTSLARSSTPATAVTPRSSACSSTPAAAWARSPPSRSTTSTSTCPSATWSARVAAAGRSRSVRRPRRRSPGTCGCSPRKAGHQRSCACRTQLRPDPAGRQRDRAHARPTRPLAGTHVHAHRWRHTLAHMWMTEDGDPPG